MPEKLLKLIPEDSEIDLYRAHAREMRRQAHFALLEAEATLAEWQAEEIDPDNFQLTNERTNFLSVARQRIANLTEKYKFWDERVKQYGTKSGKDAPQSVESAAKVPRP